MESLPITIRSDEKGYFDRECPNEGCLYTVKVLMKDWEEKVSDDEVHCPLCGHVDTADKWWTQQQLEQLNPIITSGLDNEQPRNTWSLSQMEMIK